MSSPNLKTLGFFEHPNVQTGVSVNVIQVPTNTHSPFNNRKILYKDNMQPGRRLWRKGTFHLTEKVLAGPLLGSMGTGGGGGGGTVWSGNYWRARGQWTPTRVSHIYLGNAEATGLTQRLVSALLTGPSAEESILTECMLNSWGPGAAWILLCKGMVLWPLLCGSNGAAERKYYAWIL